MCAVERFFYYITSARRSTSALQKLFEVCGFSPNVFSKLSVRNIFKTRSLTYGEVSTLVNLSNIAIFMRSDASQNLEINLNAVCSDFPWYKINLVRNIDTFFCKGPPTVKSDAFINLWDDIVSCAYSPVGFGRMGYRLPFTKPLDVNEEAVIDAGQTVIYAMSLPRLFPRERDFIESLVQKFHVEGRQLIVRPHPATPIDEMQSVMNDPRVHVDMNNSLSEDNFIYQGYGSSLTSSTLVTFASTVAIDFYLAGCREIYFVADDSYIPSSKIYCREHLQLLKSFTGAKMLYSLSEL